MELEKNKKENAQEEEVTFSGMNSTDSASEKEKFPVKDSIFSGSTIELDDEKKETPVKETAAEAEKTDDDEVVFAPVSSDTKKNTREKFNTESADEQSAAEQGIVFAGNDDFQAKHHSTPKRVSEKKKLSKVPVIAASIVLTIAAAGGILFALNYYNSSAPTMIETNSQASQSSKATQVSVKEESKVSALPVLREESAEIKTINTATITFGNNVTVSGVDLSGKTLTEAYDAMQKRLLELRDDISISINCDGKNLTLTEDDFTFNTDLTNALIQAYHFSRGELDEPTIDTVYNNGKTDFIVTSVLDRTSINSAIKKVSDTFDIQPVDAHVEKFSPEQAEKFTYADGSDGYLINQKDVTEKVTNILDQSSKNGVLSINTVKTPFKIKLADIKANTKLIASHYTTANNKWSSNFNMSLAIKSANGYVVNPGETFSFNTMTGNTTNGDLGYVPSTAIVKGKYEDQYGGGICQASTTIYLCAVKADMEIVERYAHQYPSAYADRGLDATVDYGNLDMKFKNTKDYPIYMATYVYDYNGDGLDELCVEMYGPISTEYDEIVPVGWVNSVADRTYSARGAKVYFKNGKEVKRELLPAGSYDFKYDSYDYIVAIMPSDTEYGPKDVYPTYSSPEVLCPVGVGSCGPIEYGTAEKVLAAAGEPVQTVSTVETASKPAQ